MTQDAYQAVPDQHGVNLFTSDPDLGALLPLYLPADLCRHLRPHLEQLGGLAGGVLDTLALTADKNAPTLVHRTRSGVDGQRIVKHPSYIELERVAFSQFGLAAMSHRGGVLGWERPMPAAAKYALTYLLVQAEFGLCCPLSMTDSLTRTLESARQTVLLPRPACGERAGVRGLLSGSRPRSSSARVPGAPPARTAPSGSSPWRATLPMRTDSRISTHPHPASSTAPHLSPLPASGAREQHRLPRRL